MPGWDEQIEGAEIGDATAAMLGTYICLFWWIMSTGQ